MPKSQPAPRPNPRPNPRDVVTTKAFTVWGAALAVYIVAILGRTSFGVAGVDAIERFEVDASRIAVFTAVQIGVYALAQIPMGLLIDRFGPRKMLVIGALIMAVGQTILGLTTSYWVAIGARVLIGLGDATGFLSVMRILPYWFPMKKTPLFTQLTSACGQVGQFLSAVPFLWLLNTSGWTVAFLSLGATGVLVCLAAIVAVSDTPEGSRGEEMQERARQRAERLSFGSAMKTVFRSAVCWQAFFLHWVSMVYMLVFSLLWGVPLMTLGMGLSKPLAGTVLVINTVVTILAGPFMGAVSSRAGQRRELAGILFSLAHSVGWVVFLWSPTPRTVAAVIVMQLFIGILTPAANYGFDSVREKLPRSVVATGTGMANMGGFIAGMLAAQIMGVMLDYSSHGLEYQWADFRFAWLAVFSVWAVGMVGLIIASVVLKRAEAAVASSGPVVIVDDQEPRHGD
ncbi:MFS transporter [Corynebacterium cystitidis]|uniref:MFS transporter n=1 Tax=Corynebacterium cystitidis TaxID=35757 RepID=UPI00211E1D0B|nr:MFS transporter [Corynebacterium cystitidis]